MNSKEAKVLVKEIIGYDRVYTIDTDGNVYRNGNQMSPYDNGIGYKQIKLRYNGNRFNRYIHRLVWETFKGTIYKPYEINHKDHDKSNNKLSNLELVTHSINIKKLVEKHGYYGSMNRPKAMRTLSQAKDISLEGAETTGEV